MSKIKIILILFIICFSCNTMAQKNKKKQSKDTIEVSSNIDSFVEVSEDSNKDNEIDSLKKVISILKSEIREQVDLNQHLKDRILFADSCFLRVSNDCLRKKYDKVRVDEAIVNFGRMYSPQLQKSFTPLKFLLENYENYYKEIDELFGQIENDKGMANPFIGGREASSNIVKIKTTTYYTKVYFANWTIMYLNDVIDKAIARLKNYDPKQHKVIKLTDLLK